MNRSLRPEIPSDAAAIASVTTAAFLNAPHTSRTEAFIVNALRRAGAMSVSLVAEQDGGLVGHVATSPVRVSDGTPGWHGLGPISVLPALQGQGLGSALMHAALQALRAACWWANRVATGVSVSATSRGWCTRAFRRTISRCCRSPRPCRRAR